MLRRKNKKSLDLIVLEALVKIAKAYTSPLNYHERGAMLKALGPYAALLTSTSYNRTVNRMGRQGLVEVRGRGPRIEIRLIQDGRKRLLDYQKHNLVIAKPKRWDGKWRLVIFDIPEEQKDNRRLFRYHLKSLGFERVQKSVWAYPHDCRQEVAALCELYEVVPFVSFFEGSYVGDDKGLRRAFGLDR